MISSVLGIAFDCANANDLADFYSQLLSIEKTISSSQFAAVPLPQGFLLVCQTVEGYVPPVWPWQEGRQQQMAHIDFKVDDLRAAVEHALKCGAIRAEVQYYDTSTVMLDPAGHPFCLSLGE